MTAIRARSPLLCLIVLAGLDGGRATAGGFGRPNVFSPLSLGIGGAGHAGVKNPTTIHFNPAGLILMERTEFMAALELVSAVRRYTPDSGPTEEAAGGLIPVPSLGLSTRFARPGGGSPLPVALGLAFFNSFGGGLEFEEGEVAPGVVASSLVLLEVVPALAYQPTRGLSIGVGIRLGIGIFDITTNLREGITQAPGQLSGSGLGLGVSTGVTWSPTAWLRLGVVYNSPLSIDHEGDGRIELKPGAWRPDLTYLSTSWPQWAAAGVALRAGSDLLFLASLRWTDWSAFEELRIGFDVMQDSVQVIDFTDGVAAHLGAEWQAGQRVSLRGGISYDSSCIPDQGVTRYRVDQHKVTLAAGVSVRVMGAVIIDLAYEILLAPARTVAEKVRGVVDPVTGETRTEAINPSPGTYQMMNHSLAVGARYSF